MPSHQLDALLGKSHDQASNPHDCGEVSTLPARPPALSGTAHLTYPGPPPRPLESSIYLGFDPPGWKRLISGPLDTHERISLITAILSKPDEVEMISKDDAQVFIDVIHEVRLPTVPSTKGGFKYFRSNLRDLSIRRWMT